MKIKKTKFKDLFILESKSFKDKRGFFKEMFKEKLIKKKFPFLICSFSKKHVIRGLHIQLKNPQGKLVSVIKGKIFDVALDLRPNSKTFGKNYIQYTYEMFCLIYLFFLSNNYHQLCFLIYCK